MNDKYSRNHHYVNRKMSFICCPTEVVKSIGRQNFLPNCNKILFVHKRQHDLRLLANFLLFGSKLNKIIPPKSLLWKIGHYQFRNPFFNFFYLSSNTNYGFPFIDLHKYENHFFCQHLTNHNSV